MAVTTFPALPGLAWPVKRKGPIFDTIVQDAVSGRQTAFANRVTPKWTWELSFEFLRADQAEMARLAGFHASCYGRLLPFGYRDAFDNTATNQPFGTGTGTATTFQLVRAFGGFTEPVFLPDGAPAIQVAGALKTVSTDYTIDERGRVTFTSPPASGAALTWSGGFLWLCRFDQEGIDFATTDTEYSSVESLSFTSVIP